MTSTNSTLTSSGPSANARFVVGLAAAMSSVTLTFAATESVVIILKPFALILATSGLRSGTEKPMWLTVEPIEPPPKRPGAEAAADAIAALAEA